MFGQSRQPQPRLALGLRAADKYAPQPGSADWGFERLGLSDPHRKGFDLSEKAIVLDQGPLQTCVGHAWEGALLIESRWRGYTGVNAELGSRLFGYFNARAEYDGQWADIGTYLRTYAYALQRVGRCAERFWPYSISAVNRRPNLRAYQQATAMKGLRGYYRIFEMGDSRITAIMSALEARHPVVFGMRVDSSFMNDIGSSTISIPRGPIVGGHAMCICGYTINSNGALLFKVLNSFGSRWRMGGFCWFDAEIVANWLEDVWVTSLV